MARRHTARGPAKFSTGRRLAVTSRPASPALRQCLGSEYQGCHIRLPWPVCCSAYNWMRVPGCKHYRRQRMRMHAQLHSHTGRLDRLGLAGPRCNDNTCLLVATSCLPVLDLAGLRTVGDPRTAAALVVFFCVPSVRKRSCRRCLIFLRCHCQHQVQLQPVQTRALHRCGHLQRKSSDCCAGSCARTHALQIRGWQGCAHLHIARYSRRHTYRLHADDGMAALQWTGSGIPNGKHDPQVHTRPSGTWWHAYQRRIDHCTYQHWFAVCSSQEGSQHGWEWRSILPAGPGRGTVPADCWQQGER